MYKTPEIIEVVNKECDEYLLKDRKRILTAQIVGMEYHVDNPMEYLKSYGITEGTLVTLKKEPWNKYDEEAIAVYYLDKIGYISKHDLDDVHLMMGADNEMYVEIYDSNFYNLRIKIGESQQIYPINTYRDFQYHVHHLKIDCDNLDFFDKINMEYYSNALNILTFRHYSGFGENAEILMNGRDYNIVFRNKYLASQLFRYINVFAIQESLAYIDKGIMYIPLVIFSQPHEPYPSFYDFYNALSVHIGGIKEGSHYEISYEKMLDVYKPDLKRITIKSYNKYIQYLEKDYNFHLQILE